MLFYFLVMRQKLPRCGVLQFDCAVIGLWCASVDAEVQRSPQHFVGYVLKFATLVLPNAKNTLRANIAKNVQQPVKNVLRYVKVCNLGNRQVGTYCSPFCFGQIIDY